MELLQLNVGGLGGEQIGSILYGHYVKGATVNELGKAVGSWNIARNVINGGAFEGNKQLFKQALERFPEQLDELFAVETKGNIKGQTKG